MKKTLRNAIKIRLFELLKFKWFFILIFPILIAGCWTDSIFKSSNAVQISIDGEISESTLKEFKVALELIENKDQEILLHAVQLNSHGGNGIIAREIGKIIRDKKLNTYLGEDSKCESACVFVLISGVQRYAFGKVGVHRTTYKETPDNDNNIAADISESVSEVSKYIKSMGVSAMLDDAINTTESWKMRYLTETEKRQWQVHGIDRLEEELFFNKLSRERNIPRKVFVQIFKDNYEKCLQEAKEFKATIFDCVKDRNRDQVGHLDGIIFKIKSLL